MNTQKHRVADFFDNDSSEYLEQKYASNADSFMALRRGRVNEMLMKHVVPAFNEEFRFLDCGCGPGILLDMVAKHRISYWGVDISDEMLRLARRQPAQFTSALIGKHLLRSDVESLPFRSGTFDAAASLGVIEYLEGDERLMAEMARIVKPGGHVLIAVTNKYSYNMLIDRPFGWLRSKESAVRVLNFVKLKLKLGTFRKTAFRKRRHSPGEFTRRLSGYGLRVIDSVSWGFNFLPHPLHYLCSDSLNRFANAAYNRSGNRRISRLLGEGYMVLCRRDQSS